MPRNPGREYFERLSIDTDFNRDPLEKVFRILDLLDAIFQAPDIEGKLALKGGTALQFAYLGFNRLSVDADFNYIGNVEKETMEMERPMIIEMLSRIYREFGYELERQNEHYSESQSILAYHNHGGNRDRLKIEINYSERLPILEVCSIPMNHPFDELGKVTVLSYCFEELMAQKTRALLTRGTPRDLFDIYQFSQTAIEYRKDMYRKLSIYYLCMASIDLRELTTEKIETIDDRAIRSNLLPMLRRREHRIELESMRKSAFNIVQPILEFTESERAFFNKYYDEKVFDQDLFLEEIKFDVDLAEHPVIKYRLMS